jgi:hypothetical protein
MFEQLVGIGYVAMVVSRLVGLTVMRKVRREPQAGDEAEADG